MTVTAIPSLRRPLALVGMMAAGKTAVGKRLAARFDLPFVDADAEIEAAAGMSVSAFFERHGEDEFRKGERRVIQRILEGPFCVLSTGGGAFVNDETRAVLQAKATTIWLKAELDVLVARAERKDTRPLLRGGDMREKMQALLAVREPLYALADLTVPSDDGPVEAMVDRIVTALREYATRG